MKNMAVAFLLGVAFMISFVAVGMAIVVYEDAQSRLSSCERID